MGEKTFRVLFHGQVAAEGNLEEVKRNLTSTFKITPEKLEDFFTGLRDVVARDVDYYTAQKYRRAFEKAGAVCTVTPQIESIEHDEPPTPQSDPQRPSPKIIHLRQGDDSPQCHPRFVWQMYRVGDTFHFIEDDREDVVPFDEIVLLAAFSYKQEDNRLKLIIFSKQGGNPYVADAEEIDYGDFLETEEITTAASLRKLIYRFCSINRSLTLDEATAKFVQKGVVLSLDLEHLNRYATSLEYSLRQDGLLAPPETDDPGHGEPIIIGEDGPLPDYLDPDSAPPLPSIVMCPKCGLEQQKTVECMRCGTSIIRPRLQKRKTVSLGLGESLSVPVPVFPPSLETRTFDKKFGSKKTIKEGFRQTHKNKIFAAAGIAACLAITVVALIPFFVSPPPKRMVTAENKIEQNSLTEKLKTSSLAESVSVTKKPEDKTALTTAAREGDWERVNDLLAHGTEVDQRVRYLWPPLHAAAIGGHTQVLSLLISHGADVNTQHTTGETALHCAASRGDAEVVKMLLAHGADVNAQDRNGDTPLHFAAIQGYPEVATILIKNNAVIDSKNAREATPLHFAATGGRLDTVAVLLAKGAAIHATNRIGDTPLHCAAIGGHEDVVKTLITHGAQVTRKNLRGSTPRDCATTWEHKEVAEFLGRRDHERYVGS